MLESDWFILDIDRNVHAVDDWLVPTESHLEIELATQPSDWRWAGRVAADVADRLPRPGERVAVIGCGTSYFIAQSYAALREGAGEGVTDAWPASEARLRRGYDRVLLLSRSGTTTEVLEVARALAGTVPVTAITAVAASPIADLADQSVVLERVDEQSVVQSRFATTALALLRASLGHDLDAAAEQAQRVIDGPDGELGPVSAAEQLTFLGIGWAIGVANEAALKVRETTQSWVESYPAMEYRHGPISVAGPGRVTWAIGEVPPGLADEVGKTGAEFIAYGDDPMVDLVRVHRLCVIRAKARGLDPDEPRSLSRSVTLDG